MLCAHSKRVALKLSSHPSWGPPLLPAHTSGSYGSGHARSQYNVRIRLHGRSLRFHCHVASPQRQMSSSTLAVATTADSSAALGLHLASAFSSTFVPFPSANHAPSPPEDHSGDMWELTSNYLTPVPIVHKVEAVDAPSPSLGDEVSIQLTFSRVGDVHQAARVTLAVSEQWPVSAYSGQYTPSTGPNVKGARHELSGHCGGLTGTTRLRVSPNVHGAVRLNQSRTETARPWHRPLMALTQWLSPAWRDQPRKACEEATQKLLAEPRGATALGK